MKTKIPKNKIKKRNPRKTLENKLDDIFSRVIRKKGYCQRCNKTFNLQCSHIHSRSKKSVRWDIHNAFCLCSGCHLFWWHQHPIDAAEFTKSQLGEYEYSALNRRAATLRTKIDVEEMKALYKVLEGMLNE